MVFRAEAPTTSKGYTVVCEGLYPFYVSRKPNNDVSSNGTF